MGLINLLADVWGWVRRNPEKTFALASGATAIGVSRWRGKGWIESAENARVVVPLAYDAAKFVRQYYYSYS